MSVYMCRQDNFDLGSFKTFFLGSSIPKLTFLDVFRLYEEFIVHVPGLYQKQLQLDLRVHDFM